MNATLDERYALLYRLTWEHDWDKFRRFEWLEEAVGLPAGARQITIIGQPITNEDGDWDYYVALVELDDGTRFATYWYHTTMSPQREAELVLAHIEHTITGKGKPFPATRWPLPREGEPWPWAETEPPQCLATRRPLPRAPRK